MLLLLILMYLFSVYYLLILSINYKIYSFILLDLIFICVQKKTIFFKHMMRFSDCPEIVCNSSIRWISGNPKILFQIVPIAWVVIVDLIQNFPISIMEIRSIMDFCLWLP
jgi:hypothetical protein